MSSEENDLNCEDKISLYNCVMNRKRYQDLPESNINMLQQSYQMLRMLIPNDSIESIRQKANQNDPQALLDLGDCHMFGLKNMRVSKRKAYECYKK